MRKGPAEDGKAQGNVVSFPRGLAPAARDQGVASVIRVLQEQLQRAREGKLRSIAIASVSADGASIETQCSCADGDVTDLVGTLKVLAREMIAAKIN
jgi:hypothetical protein